MKKSILMTALAGLMLASCTFEEGRVEHKSTIDFTVAPYAAQTRAEHELNQDFNLPFQVWAWTSSSNIAVIDGKAATWNNTSWSVAGGPYYWPTNSSLDFLAIYPTVANGNKYCTVTRANDGTTTINYAFTNADPNPRSINLMHSDYVQGQSSGTVKIGFRHVLAKVNVTLHQKSHESSEANVNFYEVVVTDIKVEGIYREGTYSLDAKDQYKNTHDHVWTPSGATTSINYMEPGTKQSLLTITGGAVSGYDDFSPVESKYVMPQTLTDEAKFVLKYYINSHTTSGIQKSEEKTATIKLKEFVDGATPIEHWYTNKIINYTINIIPKVDLAGIQFEVTEEEWGTINGSHDVGESL